MTDLVEYKVKEAKRSMNYEDAIKKGLDIGAIKHLFIVNVATILITITLTVIMREYIVASSSESQTLSKHGSSYMYLLQNIGFMYDNTLMRIARNKGIISNDRYKSIALNESESIQHRFINNQSLFDYQAYSDKQLSSRWTSINTNFKNMMEKSEKSRSFFYLLFEKKIELTVPIENDSPGFIEKMNEYNALSLLVNSVIYEIIHNMNRNQLSGTLDDVDLNIYLQNTLSEFLVYLSTMPVTLKDMISANLGDLSRDIITIYVLNVCLMVGSMACSIMLFVNIVRTFRRVFQCVQDLKIEDIETRVNQLSYVVSLMEKEKMYPQQLRCLTSGGDKFKKKKKRMNGYLNSGLESLVGRAAKNGQQRKNIAGMNKSFYFFTLLTSMAVLSLFYVGQFVFSGNIVSTLVSKLKKIDKLYIKQTQLLELTGIIQQYRSSALYTMIIGKSDKLNQVYFSRYHKYETSQTSRIAQLIDLVSKPLNYDSSSYDYTVNIQVSGIMTNNICNFIDQLQQYPFLCSKLDVQIPEKGMVQAFYHISDQIGYWMRELKAGRNPVQVLNSQDYISYELAVTAIYDTSMASLVQIYYDYIHYTLTVDIGNVETLITIAIVVVIVLSTLFTILSFRDIFRVKEELTYCFQTISIDGVVENQRIRVTFLRLFALDNQYFS